ncbi:odorant receptor 94a-like isoform X2 [Photinus pyralis]|uniref:odorant receptor 94a-like isoform X2 n=1 Tax=Photinus pyralis TaxID=7054 RepID=UPI0012671C92|nr:odorant receptor 94a-like isoform X2 [Photinus pyralis]
MGVPNRYQAKPGSVEFIFALSFLGTLMFQITLYCSYGNEVTIQSYRVLEACYMTEWVYRGPKVRQNLFLIMERSKRPMVMTAGKFVNLSLSSLVSVFRSAASYAMVLYQLYNA